MPSACVSRIASDFTITFKALGGKELSNCFNFGLCHSHMQPYIISVHKMKAGNRYITESYPFYVP